MSDDDRRDEERRAKLVKAGVAVGIGSAAIVAALLYASKVKKPKRGGSQDSEGADYASHGHTIPPAASAGHNLRKVHRPG